MQTDSVIGKYRIIEEIGRSSIAVVYKATQVSLGRVVALRVLNEEFSGDSEFVERFRKEARFCAKLNHPNIAQIYDVGEEKGIHYIASEYCEGKNLKEIIKREKKLSPEEISGILIQITQALDYAHRKGVFHRAIKPADIIVGKEGQVKLIDLGIARVSGSITVSGTSLRTPEYASPEQVQGKKIDARSDVYSLGILLYEMLAGQLPFQSDNPVVLARMHAEENPPALRKWTEIFPGLEQVVLKCLEKMPEKRYQTAGELRKEWEKVSTSCIERGTMITRVFRMGDTIIHRRKKSFVKEKSKRLQLIVFCVISFLLIISAFLILKHGAYLDIKSEPAGVSIYIDGTYYGKTPVVIKGLTKGKCVITGKKEGFRNFQQELTLTMGEASIRINLVRETAIARILTLPEGAHVYVDGVQKGRAPLLLKNLLPGEYEVKLVLDDYSTEKKILKIDGSRPVTLKVKLLSLHASLSVESIPAGAEIYINGVYRGLTPGTFEPLKSGRHQLLLKKDGYRDFKRNIFLRERQDFTMKAELEEKFGVLTIQSEPPSARVWLNGEFRGKTPLVLKKLHLGEYKLKMENEGYAVVEKKVVLDAGKEKVLVSVEMKKITGNLLVICTLPGARVYVDGVEKGVVKESLSVRDLIEGEHQLQVVKAGYKVCEEKFRVTPEKTVIVNVNLEKIVTKWKPTVRLRLVTGGELEGEIISRRGKEIVLRVKGGLITLKVSEVESIEKLGDK